VPESIPDFDPYSVLGVPRDAGAADISAAHKTLIRQLHPDLSPDPAASERSKRLNVARDWLVDPRRRARYDQANPVPLRTAAHAISRVQRDPRRVPDDDHTRGQIAVLVVRCSDLTRRDAFRLARAAGQDDARSAMEQAMDVARRFGRERYLRDAVATALATIADECRDPLTVEIVRMTVVGYLTADVAPLESAALLRPWQDAIERPDARARSRRIAIADARRRLGSAMLRGFGFVFLALAAIGLVSLVGILAGWIG